MDLLKEREKNCICNKNYENKKTRKCHDGKELIELLSDNDAVLHGFCVKEWGKNLRP